MFGSNKRYLSIAINEGVIKVAQVRSSGVIEKIARASVAGTSTPEDLAKALKTLLNGFDRGSTVLSVIPASAATSKNIEVPSSDPNEIKSIINLQASRYTPYSREEVLIGHINLGVGTGSNTKLLLVIAHRNVVKERMTVIEKCGLMPANFLFAPEGQGRLYAKGLNLKKDADPVGVIDFGSSGVNFLVIARGSVIFSRHIPFTIKQLFEADGVAKIGDELKKSLDAFVSEDIDRPPTSMVVSTDNELIKTNLAALGEKLGVPIQISSYLNLVNANAVKGKLQRDYADESFLDVIAPAATVAKAEINLMPEEIILKRSVEEQSKEATVSGIAAVVLMLLIGGIFMSKIYFKDTFLNKNLRQQYAEQNEEVSKLQDRMAQSRIVHDYLKDRMVSLDAIRALYQVTPNDIYLTGVALADDGTMTLSGVSKSLSQVFTYVKALDDAPMFVDAKTKSTSTKKEGDKDVAVFEVTLKLNDGHKEQH